ncbi:Uncharacterized protein PBTT_06410 [Plasmodiophora brassicae]
MFHLTSSFHFPFYATVGLRRTTPKNQNRYHCKTLLIPGTPRRSGLKPLARMIFIDFVQLGCTLLQHCDAPELPDCQHDDKKTLEAFGRFVEFLYICDMGHAYCHRSPHESGVKQGIFHGMRRVEPAPLGHPLRKHSMFALSDAFSMYDADDYANVMSYLTDLHGGDDVSTPQAQPQRQFCGEAYQAA